MPPPPADADLAELLRIKFALLGSYDPATMSELELHLWSGYRLALWQFAQYVESREGRDERHRSSRDDHHRPQGRQG
jgi:hypothetical protein